MGRKLMRVALDFDWPINKRWKGYINPHYEKCKLCDGYGITIARQRLTDLVSLLMISGEDAADSVRRGRDRCHPYLVNDGLFNTSGKLCGADMTELTAGLAGRQPCFLGHDGCDRYVATTKVIAAAGLDPDKWGICPNCSGHGVPNGKWELWEAWKGEDPPVGDGYQIWETTTEGSPISPVFATVEDLARWMAANEGGEYDSWMRFIQSGKTAPSFVVGPNGVQSGVDYVAEGEKQNGGR